MSSKIKNVINTIQNKTEISEHRGFKYKGVRLSRADAELIIMQLKTFLARGDFFGSPTGGVKKVLDQII